MANEFVARRGIIAQSGGAKITGSLLVSGTVDATGYSIIGASFTGSFSGSIGTAISSSYAVTASYAANAGGLAGVVSSSTQFKTLTDPFTGSFTGSFTGDGSGLTGIASTLTFSGSTTGNDTLNLKTEALIFSGSNGLSATVTNNTVTFAAPAGTVSASSQIDYNSIQNKLSGVVSSSQQVAPLLPNGTVSSSAQYPGWVTSSAQIDYNSIQNKLSGVVSSSAQVQPLLPGGTVSSSAQYPGWVTSSTQVVWSSVNYNTGIVSSSAQTVANIAGQTIAPSTINATGAISGASIQVSGNGIIGGNLNVTGTITATSQSIQYISSSQLNVATNTIIVNTDNSLRFGGLSVVDSGSVGKSGSLFWDSLTDRWIYEDVSGGQYNSAILVAGPKNIGTTGNERGLVDGRVPVASGDDHIDTAPASSSIRVDFPSRLTHVEAGLFITGALTANGTVTLQGIPSSSAQVTALLPNGTVSSSAQYPGWVTASSQIDVRNTTGIATIATTGSNTFTATQTIQGNIFLNTTFPLVYNNSNTNNMLFGLYDGSTIHGAYYQVFGNNYASLNQRGGAEFVFDIRNNSDSNFHVSSYDGNTWVQRFRTDTNGAQVTGSLNVTGVISGSTSAYLTNTLYSGSTVTNIVGPVTNQIVATLPTANYDGVFFDYVIKDGTNYRAGTVMVVANGTNAEFTDVSTNDIGNTAQVSFSADISGGLIRLKFTNISGTWTFKTAIRAL